MGSGFAYKGALARAVWLCAERARDDRALDRMIAAHAVSVGLTLNTSKRADFRNFPALQVGNRVAAACAVNPPPAQTR